MSNQPRKYCFNHGTGDTSDLGRPLQRVYARSKGGWKPIGWLCDICLYVDIDRETAKAVAHA